jgi:hypothetical protein
MNLDLMSVRPPQLINICPNSIPRTPHLRKTSEGETDPSPEERGTLFLLLSVPTEGSEVGSLLLEEKG